MSVRSNAKQRQRRVKLLQRRDGELCWVCGEAMAFPVVRKPTASLATIDHVIPLAAGGSNDISNIRLAHYRCNSTRRVNGQSDPNGNPDHRFYLRGRRKHPTRYWEMFSRIGADGLLWETDTEAER